jgi:hypothetical protein
VSPIGNVYNQRRKRKEFGHVILSQRLVKEHHSQMQILLENHQHVTLTIPLTSINPKISGITMKILLVKLHQKKLIMLKIKTVRKRKDLLIILWFLKK